MKYLLMISLFLSCASNIPGGYVDEEEINGDEQIRIILEENFTEVQKCWSSYVSSKKVRPSNTLTVLRASIRVDKSSGKVLDYEDLNKNKFEKKLANCFDKNFRSLDFSKVDWGKDKSPELLITQPYNLRTR